jgi:hypothetical protein
MWGNPMVLGIVPLQRKDELATAMIYGMDEPVFEPFNRAELEQRIDLSLCRRPQPQAGRWVSARRAALR